MTLGTVFSTRDGARLLTGGARLPRDTLQALQQAEQIVQAAEAAAEALRAQARQDAAAQQQRAHAEGLAHGRAEALGQVLGTLDLERRLREILSAQLADVVERTLRSLLGEAGEATVLRQRVLHLLRCGGADDAGTASATLHVHPQDAERLRLALADAGAEDGLSALVCIPDVRRTPGSLLLEMRGGFVESDLALTIDQVREMVRAAVERAAQQSAPTP